jgi:tRNA threonylcarbamoyl adenosine modification protein YeaZ
MKTVDEVLYLVIIASSDSSIKVGLFRGFECLSAKIETQHRMSAQLLIVIEEVLKAGNVELKQLGFIAVTQGPGLFSHLRAALALCNGIALASRIPLIGIDLLHTWSDLLPVKYEKLAQNILVVIVYNAYNNEVHYRIDKVCGFEREILAGPAYADRAYVQQLVATLRSQVVLCMISGDACDMFDATELQPVEVIRPTPEKELECLARAALWNWAQRRPPVYELQPLYLKETQFKKSE